MLALALLVFGNTVVGTLINLLIFGITTDDDESDDSDSDDSGEYSLPELTYKRETNLLVLVFYSKIAD